MLCTLSLPLRVLAATAVAATAVWAAEDSGASALADLYSMSDEELMRGTKAGGSIPAVYKLCPRACDDLKPSKWTIYSDYQQLKSCDKPMLFDFAIYNPIEDPDTTTRIRVCSLQPEDSNSTQPSRRAETTTTPRAGFSETIADLTLAQNGTVIGFGDIVQGPAQALQLLHDGFAKDYNETLASIMFSYYRENVAAVYAGTGFDKGTIPSLISSLIATLTASNSSSETVVTQLCGGSRGTESTLGAIMTTAENIGLVQNSVRNWADGNCAPLPGITATSTYKAKIWEAPIVNGTLGGNSTHLRMKRARPVKNADGSCYFVTTIKDDNCDKIGRPLSLTSTMIHSFNIGKTWGWKDCPSMQPDMNICLSDGDPPVPYPIDEATCGPTVPGTVFTGGKALKDYNPCPLNVCCNVWGNCGLNQDFCISDDGPSPGTSNLKNGCVSNCGNKIIQSGAPAAYQRIGYFETWNVNRPCLNMKVKDANTDGTYTHIHWAFLEVSGSFGVVVKDPDNQWEDFKGMKEKKIGSFGGWAYSTEPATYEVLRQATGPDNRVTFANNVVDFLIQHNLDGVDFDWEYPGAPDIPGIPPGLKEDGLNYLKFLMEIKKILSAKAPGKTLSIAAPASYWYLRAFPIDRMSAVLDYIVYMTYDLHGQWDAGNKWSIEGCDKGNCVRSHVNKTETLLALSMITKAGVPSNKIFVGESSYGRSFKLSVGGCQGFFCTFTGDRLNSNAAKGKCTDTAGYISDGEIADIAKSDPNAKKYYDADSDSDIMIYGAGRDEWVAHMAPDTKKARREVWRGMNFAGTIDWAVDLQGDASGGGKGGEVVYIGTEVYTTNTAKCFGPCTMVFPPSLLQSPTVISIPPYTSSLEVGRTGPQGLVVVTRTITVTVQPVTVTEMPYGNVRISSSSSTGAIVITPSVDLPLQTVVVTGPDSKESTRTVTLPPWPWILSGVPESWTGFPNGTTTTDDEYSRLTSWWEIDAPKPTKPPTDSVGPEPTFLWPYPDPKNPDDPDDDDDDGPWPPGIIWPITKDDDPKEDKKKRVSCKVWFFFVCISWGEIHIDFWSFDFPGGSILPPGPPPPPQISLPPGFKIVGTPKWPKISIGPDGVPTPPPKPDACTPTSQAKLEITTLSYKFTVTQGTTRTTATETISTDFPILGCEDKETTTSKSSCPLPTPISKRSIELVSEVNKSPKVEIEQIISGPDDQHIDLKADLKRSDDRPLEEQQLVQANMNQTSVEHEFERRAGEEDCDGTIIDFYLIPSSPTENIAEIRHFLEARKSDGLIESFVEVGSTEPATEWTAFWYVRKASHPKFTDAVNGKTQGIPGIIQYLVERGYKATQSKIKEIKGVTPPSAARRRGDEGMAPVDSHNGTEGEGTLLKRELTWDKAFHTTNWAPSLLSIPPGYTLLDGDEKRFRRTDPTRYGYYSDPSSCEGQFIYVIDYCVQWSHTELSGFSHREMEGHKFGAYEEWMEEEEEHGTFVASSIAGATIGVCRKGTVISVRRTNVLRGTDGRPSDPEYVVATQISGLVLALEDISKNKHGSKSVINMSWGVKASDFEPDRMKPWKNVFRLVLQKLASLDVVLVAAAGNEAMNGRPTIDTYPQLFVGDGVDDLIVVGASSIDSRLAYFSQTGGALTTYAGGWNVEVADNKNGGRTTTDGTSFAAPQVAALAAYLRALPAGKSGDSSRFTKPGDVKKWVQKLSRKVPLNPKWPNLPALKIKAAQFDGALMAGGEPVALVWNGQVGDHSCIVDDSHEDCVKIDINDPTPVDGGENCNNPGTGSSNPSRRRSLLRWAREVFWQNGDIAGEGSMNFTVDVAHEIPSHKYRAREERTKKNVTLGAMEQVAAKDLFARQGAAACPLFPQGPTKTIQYSSGSPSPTCNAAAGGHCGKLCKGFYCEPSPGVRPPDFSASQPTTTNPGGITDLPPLPSTSDWFIPSPALPGATCVSSETRTSVGGPGGGHGQATITSSGCVSWNNPNLPTLEPTPWFPTSPPGGSCVSSATLTSIGGPGGGGGQQATITSSGCMSWSTSTSKQPEPTSNPEPNYPYTWYVYAAAENDPLFAKDIVDYFLTFSGSPDCKDVGNARTLAAGEDCSGNSGHCIRCVGCSVCAPGVCGNDKGVSPSVMEIRTPTTHVTWYLDRDGNLVDTNNVPGGKCEADTTHDFECILPLSPVWGSRMLKCKAVFSQASMFSKS